MVSIKNRVLLAVGLLAAGCGIYSFRGNLPVHIHSISIAGVVNQTSEFIITDLARDLVTDKFVEENVIRVAGEGEADSDLQITIVRVTDKPATVNVGESVLEWELTVFVKVIWYDLTKNRPLFEMSINGTGYYPPGGDIGSDNIDNDRDGQIDEADEIGDPRQFALETAINKISEDILNEVVSTW